MARDSVETTSEIVGAPFAVNAGANAGGGDMILFNGVPHVAWCEYTGAVLPRTYYGPYVARWDGASWVLVTPEGALPDAVDPGDPSLVIPIQLADTCPAIYRYGTRFATDGNSLYVAVIGTVVSRIRFPGGDSDVPSYHFYELDFMYGFRLDGSAWTSLGDPIYGMFPATVTVDGTDVAYTSGNALGGFNDWDISASPDNPGNCYFAFSFHGDNPFPILGPPTVDALAVVGTDLAETLLADDSWYSTRLDGGGSSLTLYCAPAEAAGWTYDKVLTWSYDNGFGEIDASQLGIPYLGVILGTTAETSMTTVDGVRYLVLSGQFDFTSPTPDPSTDVRLTLVKTQDPLFADAVAPLAPGFSTYDGPAPDLDVADIIVDRFAPSHVPDKLLVEPRNYWIPTGKGVFLDGACGVLQLDRQCRLGSLAWTLNRLPSSTFRSGQAILYEDAFWWFAFDDGISPDVVVDDVRLSTTALPQVWRTPICRGCLPCPTSGLHVWHRG